MDSAFNPYTARDAICCCASKYIDFVVTLLYEIWGNIVSEYMPLSTAHYLCMVCMGRKEEEEEEGKKRRKKNKKKRRERYAYTDVWRTAWSRSVDQAHRIKTEAASREIYVMVNYLWNINQWIWRHPVINIFSPWNNRIIYRVRATVYERSASERCAEPCRAHIYRHILQYKWSSPRYGRNFWQQQQ